jgi:ABC-2 type transport system ATP-binding protein
VNSNVHIDSLTHAFGSTQVLKGINLAIGNGVFGLLGPNGAGKTTLLRCLATAMDADGGRLRLLGYDPSVYAERRAFRRRLGYLPQQFGYYPNFTVWEFVEYFALLKEIPASETPHKVAQAIRRVGLEDRARKQLRTLSGGMLRRAGIAQAIVNEPSLLLLDEPTAGLDPEQRVDFRRLLREAGEHGTVIVSTHLVEDVGAACSEVAVMAEGEIVFRGTPAELTDLGDPNGPGDSPLERGYIAALRSVQVEVLA